VLVAGIDWVEFGAIAAAVIIPVTIITAILTIRSAKAKAKVKVSALLDASGLVQVLVSNERGTNTISITSVALVVLGDVVSSEGDFSKTDLKGGTTRDWRLQLGGTDAPDGLQVRVDSGWKHWLVTPNKTQDLIVDA
jgi:hypothetical protein